MAAEPASGQALEVLERAVDVPAADEVEAVLFRRSGGLTRFADSAIHQHTETEDATVRIRAFAGKRSAAVSTNRLDPASLASAGKQALEAARLCPEDHLHPGLPSESQAGQPLAAPLSRYDAATAATGPMDRAAMVKRAVTAASGCSAAGSLSCESQEVALANSSGIRRHDATTLSSFTCLMRRGDGTAFMDRSSWRWDGLEPQAWGEDLAGWAARAQEPEQASPGTYPVVLMPLAVAEMLEYLSYMGFGAKDVLNGDSFLVDRAGQRVASDLVTINDDAAHPGGLGICFDLEGVWHQKVPLIERGIAGGPVYDSRTAAEAGASTTGHASGSKEMGPIPLNLVLEPGTSTTQELIAGVERGLLVRRFWYVNVVDQRKTVLTGMTRDGLFMIEGGQVARPATNLRFTQSVLEALAGCEAAGSELQTLYTGWGMGMSVTAPALRLAGFNFTSATTH